MSESYILPQQIQALQQDGEATPNLFYQKSISNLSIKYENSSINKDASDYENPETREAAQQKSQAKRLKPKQSSNNFSFNALKKQVEDQQQKMNEIKKSVQLSTATFNPMAGSGQSNGSNSNSNKNVPSDKLIPPASNITNL